jgi:hypothetical protein
MSLGISEEAAVQLGSQAWAAPLFGRRESRNNLTPGHGGAMGVTTDEKDILVELVTQTIDPKLFTDRPAMGNVVTARYI